MATTVSIDVDAARGVVSALRGVFDDAMDEWTDVANAAARALCSTTSLKALSDPLVLVSQSAKDLETRIELAIVYNTGDDGALPTGGVLTYTLTGSDTIANVKQELGSQIADGLEGLSPYGEYLSREDVERMEYYTSMLEKYAEDSDVMDGLFTELGPQGVVEVPILLKDFATQYQMELGGKFDEDLFWDEDTPMSSRISELQQRFMEAYGDGLATAVASDAFNRENSDFAEDIVKAVTESRNGLGWALSEILRYGEYDADFLESLGTGLYDFEIQQDGAVWGPQVATDEWSWRLGTDDDGQYFDPFVGLLEAMGRTPEAAANFFNPDGGGTQAQERSQYLIQERTWRADDFNALGEALDAAATSFHNLNASPELQEQAAWIASATIHYLGERDAGRNDRRIGEAGKDSLAHILATYITDVDRVANNQDAGGRVGTYQPDFTTAPWLMGLPIGADFSLETLNAVLGEVLTDNGAMAQLAEAAAAWNSHRIETAVGAWNDGTGSSNTVSGSLQGSGQLMGYLLGNLERGSEAAGKEVDERNKQFVDLASDVVGLIPTGGTFVSFLADQAQSAGKDRLEDAVTGNEAAARALNESAQERTRIDLQLALAVAVADSPHLPDSVRTDENGQAYPWFDDAGFDETALEDQDTRNLFLEWMRNDADEIISLVPDMGQAYDDGLDRGR